MGAEETGLLQDKYPPWHPNNSSKALKTSRFNKQMTIRNKERKICSNLLQLYTEAVRGHISILNAILLVYTLQMKCQIC